MVRAGSRQVRSKTTPVDFDLRQLEVFCRVVELGSISKAADVVFLTQSSVSERMANLERSIGSKLLDKIGRVIEPTAVGKLLYEQALKHLALKDETRQSIEGFQGITRGEAIIGGSTIPGEYILPTILEGFHKRFPQVRLQLHIHDTYEVARRVADAEVSLGVIGSRAPQKMLAYEELWSDELVLAVPAKHPWARSKVVGLEDLAREPFVMRESGSGTRRLLEEKLAGLKTGSAPALDVIAELGSSAALKTAVIAGMGVGAISARALTVEVQAGLIAAVRVHGLQLKRRFYLVYHKRRTLSPICEALRQFIVADARKGRK